MPVIELKTTTKLSKQARKNIAAGFSRCFAEAGEEVVARNILPHIEDEVWIDFRKNAEEPSALVVVHPGPMTPVEDYRPIIDGFFRVLEEDMPEVAKDRIYMTVSEIRYWGWDGRLL